MGPAPPEDSKALWQSSEQAFSRRGNQHSWRTTAFLGRPQQGGGGRPAGVGSPAVVPPSSWCLVGQVSAGWGAGPGSQGLTWPAWGGWELLEDSACLLGSGSLAPARALPQLRVEATATPGGSRSLAGPQPVAAGPGTRWERVGEGVRGLAGEKTRAHGDCRASWRRGRRV